MKIFSFTFLLTFTTHFAYAQILAPSESIPKRPGVIDPGKPPQAPPPLGKKNILKTSDPLLPYTTTQAKSQKLVPVPQPSIDEVLPPSE